MVGDVKKKIDYENLSKRCNPVRVKKRECMLNCLVSYFRDCDESSEDWFAKATETAKI